MVDDTVVAVIATAADYAVAHFQYSHRRPFPAILFLWCGAAADDGIVGTVTGRPTSLFVGKMARRTADR